MTASYATLFRRPPARRLIYALSAACLSYGMLGLTVLLIVQHATLSYPAAGLAVAAFSLTAGLSAPARGRVVDRLGARRWLPILASGYAASIVAIAVASEVTSRPWVFVALAGLAGASAPPLFASARSVWPQAVEPELLRRGYAFTSLLSDAGMVIGPAVAGLLFVVAGWVPALVCAAAAPLSAALSVPSASSAAASARPEPMPRLRGNLPLLMLLVVSVTVGVAEGLVQVAVPTIAGRSGDEALAGPLLAAFAFGSVAGALWFGSRQWRLPVIDRYLGAVLALGVLLAPVGLARTPAVLAGLLVVAGLAFGPATVSLFEALDVLAPGSGAESLTWVTTAEAAGAAAGAAAAGLLVIHVAAWSPFLIASGVLVVPAGLALRARHRVR
ncbi:MAG: MFS transporter [Actinomycetes bacterium]